MKYVVGSGNNFTVELASSGSMIVQDNASAKISQIDNDTKEHDYQENIVRGYKVEIEAKTAPYSIVDADHGKVITVSSNTSTQITVPQTITAGFACVVSQIGSGQVVFVGGGTMNIRNRQGYSKLASKYSEGSLKVVATNECLLSGDVGS